MTSILFRSSHSIIYEFQFSGRVYPTRNSPSSDRFRIYLTQLNTENKIFPFPIFFRNLVSFIIHFLYRIRKNCLKTLILHDIKNTDILCLRIGRIFYQNIIFLRGIPTFEWFRFICSRIIATWKITGKKGETGRLFRQVVNVVKVQERRRESFRSLSRLDVPFLEKVLPSRKEKDENAILQENWHTCSKTLWLSEPIPDNKLFFLLVIP